MDGMDLRERLNARSDRECSEVRWKLRCLRTGFEAGRDADTQQWSASTRKVSVMMAFLSRVCRGLVSMDEEIVYTEELGRGVQSGTFRYMSPGFTFTLRDALANMIVTSDNVCTGAIFRALGPSDDARIQVVNDYCRAVGMRKTVHRHTWLDTRDVAWHHTDENMTMTSAEDQVALLVAMVEASGDAQAARRLGVTPELCSLALELMGRENGLLGMAGLLPEGASMASKSGRDMRGRGHVGVAYRDGAPLFAMAIYVDWVPTELPDGTPGNAKALELIAELTRIAWDGLSPEPAASPRPARVGA